MTKDRLALYLVCLCGFMLHAYTGAFRSDGPFDVFLVGLLAWSCLPYATAAFASLRSALSFPALGYAAGALSGDLFMHYSVFIAPKGSTAALGLLFMPMWNLLLLGPLGALSLWAARRVYRSRQASAGTASQERGKV